MRGSVSSPTQLCTAPHTRQGIPPAGLARVQNGELRDFITLCIQFDPSARPSALQLLKHAFFDSLRTGGVRLDV